MASIEPTVDSALPRYLVTEVGGQRIAWELAQVKEIITARVVTRLPGSPIWVLGLLNLRGSVLTVVDLATRLGLVRAGLGSVVVIDAGGRSLGVRVDVVRSVASVEDAVLEPVDVARSADGLFVGMVHLEEGPAALIDAPELCRMALAAV